MTHDIYINGERLDLYPDEGVTLEYQSNILGDLSQITGSYSYTVKVPRTVRNTKILDDPTNPAYTSSSRGVYMPAKYLRNGLDPIGECSAVLLDSGEDYEIALTWGPLQGLEKWINDAGSLRDLQITDYIKWAYGNSSEILTAYNSRVAPLILADYDPGVDLASVPGIMAARHPSTNLFWLFDRMMSEAGISYDIPDDVITDMKNKAILLSSRNSGDEVNILRGVKSTGARISSATLSKFLYPVGTITDDTGIYDSANKRFNVINNVKTVRFKIYAEFDASYFTDTAKLSVRGTSIDPIREYELKKTGVDMIIDIDDSIDVSGTTYYYFIITGFTGSSDAIYNGGNPFMIYPQYEEVTPNNDYPLRPNLPDIKQTDLVKAICWFYGLNAIANSQGSLKLISLDDLFRNKETAKDWSAKLIDGNRGMPDTTGFSFGDFARRNWLRYKEDSENLGLDADGYMDVSDSTLESEKDLVTLPFAASRFSRIRHYTATRDDSGWDVELQEVEPRLLRIRSSAAKCALIFDDNMRFDQIIKQRYNGYAALIYKQISISVKMRLTELDLKNLDFSVPVYLRQYGRFYAIKSIRTDAQSDICEVDLYQLSV